MTSRHSVTVVRILAKNSIMFNLSCTTPYWSSSECSGAVSNHSSSVPSPGYLGNVSSTRYRFSLGTQTPLALVLGKILRWARLDFWALVLDDPERYIGYCGARTVFYRPATKSAHVIHCYQVCQKFISNYLSRSHS